MKDEERVERILESLYFDLSEDDLIFLGNYIKKLENRIKELENKKE